MTTDNLTCIIVGASHAGVNAAFTLRNQGWQGKIILIDKDQHLPYHKPPLSKKALTAENQEIAALLKPEASYQQANIELILGAEVSNLNRETCTLDVTENGSLKTLQYDKLVLATGARPFIPPIPGLAGNRAVFAMRTLDDVKAIRACIDNKDVKRAVIIGGGYIGLETASSLLGLGLSVTLIEREKRLLARVTAPVMSDFFKTLHQQKGVEVLTGLEVVSVNSEQDNQLVLCDDGTSIETDMIIVGVGIKVNAELAEQAGLKIDNGISVDEYNQSSDNNIYAIGDCANFKHSMFTQKVRLESVQNAVDQAKIVAKNLCGETIVNTAVPWFWSDQYDYKLQMVGLATGFDEIVLRREPAKQNPSLECLSAWYFKNGALLSVDAVNNSKAYVLGTKAIQTGTKINRAVLADENEPLNHKTLFLA